LLGAACELGDAELADLLRADLRRDDAVLGERPIAGLSTTVNAMACLGMLGRRDGWRDMLSTPLPAEIRAGPLLVDAPHPGVMVARAVSDGVGLDLVLRPGNGGGRVRLGLGRLVPGQRYSLRGAVGDAVVADAASCAELEVDLDRRSEVAVTAA
jgi:hypothetical protein